MRRGQDFRYVHICDSIFNPEALCVPWRKKKRTDDDDDDFQSCFVLGLNQTKPICVVKGFLNLIFVTYMKLL